MKETKTGESLIDEQLQSALFLRITSGDSMWTIPDQSVKGLWTVVTLTQDWRGPPRPTSLKCIPKSGTSIFFLNVNLHHPQPWVCAFWTATCILLHSGEPIMRTRRQMKAHALLLQKAPGRGWWAQTSAALTGCVTSPQLTLGECCLLSETASQAFNSLRLKLLSIRVWKATSAPMWAMGQNVHSSWTTRASLKPVDWVRTRSGSPLWMNTAICCSEKQMTPHQGYLFVFFPPDSGRHQNEAFDVIFPSEEEMIFFVRINCICLTLIVTSKTTGEIQFYDIERESDVHENEPNYYFFKDRW